MEDARTKQQEDAAMTHCARRTVGCGVTFISINISFTRHKLISARIIHLHVFLSFLHVLFHFLLEKYSSSVLVRDVRIYINHVW